MDNIGVKGGEQISREFYPQNGLNSEMAQGVSVEVKREIGEVAKEAAVFSKPEETPVENLIFDEMIKQPQSPEFGKIETVDNGERQRNLDLGGVEFTSYTKEFSKADGKIAEVEMANLQINPFAGYEALQNDRMKYLKTKFNRELK